ncbi:hypothetical protein IFR05_016001 [Cadophora sp. M221]|nr:hypothetical protein IFR05_016001 [Cadophora sp. M221]
MATANAPEPVPIVFKARGLEIDTRLRVFDTVFHVHSTILKLHSQYFYRFLDSADKAAGTNDGGFEYDWVTKIVDGGNDWQLICSGPNAGDLKLAEWKTCPHVNSGKRMQTNAFQNVLRAMYALPYVLNQGYSIIIMTELARFYMCLPIISQTLDGAISRSQKYFGIQVSIFSCQMLSAAVELRHMTLFKDALIWSLGPFSQPKFYDIADKSLKRVAELHYYKLRSIILEDIQRILKCVSHADAFEGGAGPGRVIFEHGMAAEATAARHSNDATSFTPRLLNSMCEEAKRERDHGDDDGLYDQLKSLLRNDLSMDLGSLRVAGSEAPGGYPDYFLLSTIDSDDDYPWDVTQLEW